MKQAKDIKPIKLGSLKKRSDYMSDKFDELCTVADSLRVRISSGNRKTGAIPSVSLRPVLDCPNADSCKRLCYDMRNDCIYPTVMNSRAVNAAIFATDPDRYFNEISTYCKTCTAFRWHIGGDIVNARYLLGMVSVAVNNPQCKFLAFTKNFDLINTYLDRQNLPDNLVIIFSGWVGLYMPNPHNLPTSHPIFSNGKTSAPKGAIPCGGNCLNCFITGSGCWDLNKGESVIFAAH